MKLLSHWRRWDPPGAFGGGEEKLGGGECTEEAGRAAPKWDA